MIRPAGAVLVSLAVCLMLMHGPVAAGTAAYRIVDSGQDHCFDNSVEISCPHPGQAFYGQDAQYQGHPPAYRDNGDGTVSDLNTGLMWSKGLGTKKVSLAGAQAIARTMTLGGHADWRVPTIKELYSLIDFRGYTGFAPGRMQQEVPANAVPFIDTDYFDFAYGDVRGGERYIDAQWLSSTEYVSTTMDGMDTLFGVNFADGRIKGYGYRKHGTRRVVKTFYARFVRGHGYGINNFVDNGDGTVSDRSTGLMWMRGDSGKGMTWSQALAWAQSLNLAGHRDWRLPNAKELQSIVDYSRSPDTTASPAIDPIFRTTAITNEAGQKDYPFFWTSTTHRDGPRPGSMAAYVAFGRAMGAMWGRTMDVHGAGAQRSDPKTGRPELGHGPQGDARRVENFVRCVRGGTAAPASGPAASGRDRYPLKLRICASLPGISSRNLGPAGMPGGRDTGRNDRRPPGRPGFVQRLDRDGDGRVSRAEFDGPADRFDFHDKNHDGYLTEDEAPQGPPPGGPHRRY